MRTEDELLLIPSTPVSAHSLNITHVFVLFSVHGFSCGVYMCGFGVFF